MLDLKEKLIVALDVPTLDKAEELVDKLCEDRKESTYNDLNKEINNLIHQSEQLDISKPISLM